MERIGVRKTLKLFIGGEFRRSESGHTLVVQGGDRTIRVSRASRKDVRDAVRAAKGAWPNWRDRAGYNRGQILYRLAEIMESRRAQFVETLSFLATRAGAQAEVSAAIDRVVWYAGWCDKLEQILSTKNPVGINHFNVSSPEPTGVVGIVAPQAPALLGLVSSVCAVVCSGNCAVALCSKDSAATAIAFAESVATADVPGGVINILTSDRREAMPTLAAHLDVNALDLWIAGPEADAAALLACDSVKRARRGGEPPRDYWFGPNGQGLEWIEAFVEIKTVWHPASM